MGAAIDSLDVPALLDEEPSGTRRTLTPRESSARVVLDDRALLEDVEDRLEPDEFAIFAEPLFAAVDDLGMTFRVWPDK